MARYSNAYWRGGRGIGPGARRLSAALAGPSGVDVSRMNLLDAKTQRELMGLESDRREQQRTARLSHALSGNPDLTDMNIRRELGNMAFLAGREGGLGDLMTHHAIGDPALTGDVLAATGDLGPNVAVSKADRDAMIASAQQAELDKALGVQRLRNAAPMALSAGQSLVTDPTNPQASIALTAPSTVTLDADQRLVGVGAGSGGQSGAGSVLVEPDVDAAAALARSGAGGSGSTSFSNYYSPSTGQTVLGRVQGNQLVDRNGNALPPDAVKLGVSTTPEAGDVGLVERTNPARTRDENLLAATDDLEPQVDALISFLEQNPGVTGVTGALSRTVSGVTGQVVDALTALGRADGGQVSDDNDITGAGFQDLRDQVAAAAPNEAASVFALMMLDIAYARARIADPGGRLSDRDLQVQLSALGGDLSTSGAQALAKLRQAKSQAANRRDQVMDRLGDDHETVRAIRARQAKKRGGKTIEQLVQEAEAAMKGQQ